MRTPPALVARHLNVDDRKIAQRQTGNHAPVIGLPARPVPGDRTISTPGAGAVRSPSAKEQGSHNNHNLGQGKQTMIAHVASNDAATAN